jgi:hypothetical protein
MVTFKDLEFKPKKFGHISGGTSTKYEFDNGYSISVVAGEHMYSTPKQNLDDPEDYSSFEVAVFKGEEWATKQFLPDHHDDVIGYQDRGEINSLMLLIQSEKKKVK